MTQAETSTSRFALSETAFELAPLRAALAPALREWCAHPQFRGCAFINTVAELGPALPAAGGRARAHQRAGQARIADLCPDARARRARARMVAVAGDGAPWEETGRLIARCHRAGLDHADLNATNLLFDPSGRGWVIDLDRGQFRIPATGWRERNLARLKRSLLKLRGQRPVAEVERDFARLRTAYDRAWERGY